MQIFKAEKAERLSEKWSYRKYFEILGIFHAQSS